MYHLHAVAPGAPDQHGRGSHNRWRWAATGLLPPPPPPAKETKRPKAPGGRNKATARAEGPKAPQGSQQYVLQHWSAISANHMCAFKHLWPK